MSEHIAREAADRWYQHDPFVKDEVKTGLAGIIQSAIDRATAAQAEQIAGLLSSLVAVARAAYSLADNSSQHGNDDFIRCESDDLDDLSKALNALDDLPDPPNEIATGPRKAEHQIESTTAGTDLLREVERLRAALEVRDETL